MIKCKCGYRWMPRVKEPKCCPKCKAYLKVYLKGGKNGESKPDQ